MLNLKDKKTVGQRLRAIRQYRGYTQLRLTELIGEKSSSIFSNWEQDLSALDVKRMLKICRLLDVDPAYMLGFSSGEKIPSLERDRLISMLQDLDEEGLRLTSAVTQVQYENALESRELDPLGYSRRPINFLELPYPSEQGNVRSRKDARGLPVTLDVKLDDVSRSADFVLEVVGRSMEPNFSGGDIILLRVARIPAAGEYGVFGFRGEALFRRLGKRHLIACNESYGPIELPNRIRCHGWVVGKAAL